MHDYFSEHFEWDGNVPRKKKRVAHDREELRFPMSMAFRDAAGFHQHFSDGTPDHTSPHRKGFRFLDVNDAARLAADAAYEQQRQRLANAWRNKDVQAGDNRDATPPTRTLDELRQAAEVAWQERSKRMSNAWRHKEG
jgi:hypothetical protein